MAKSDGELRWIRDHAKGKKLEMYIDRMSQKELERFIDLGIDDAAKKLVDREIKQMKAQAKRDAESGRGYGGGRTPWYHAGEVKADWQKDGCLDSVGAAFLLVLALAAGLGLFWGMVADLI